MSLGILNNIAALYAQNNLNSTQSNLQNTLTQLSSGSRINSGADDAAGLAVADGLHANEAALTQSSANATDGIGLLQTADGALSQVHQPPRSRRNPLHRSRQRHPHHRTGRLGQPGVPEHPHADRQHRLYHQLQLHRRLQLQRHQHLRLGRQLERRHHLCRHRRRADHRQRRHHRRHHHRCRGRVHRRNHRPHHRRFDGHRGLHRNLRLLGRPDGLRHTALRRRLRHRGNGRPRLHRPLLDSGSRGAQRGHHLPTPPTA